MTEILISVWYTNSHEVKKLKKGTQVLRYDSLYSEYKILVVGKDRFPNAKRFHYFLLAEPEETSSITEKWKQTYNKIAEREQEKIYANE